jgi:predicted kinase
MEDNMSAKLIFLVGLSGSGKSTWAEEFIKDNDAELLSSDRLRLELFGDENDQRHNSEVFNELHRRAIDFLKKGKTVVYDATGLSGSRRKSFINQLSRVDCWKICVVFAVPFSECIERDLKRDRCVGREVILKQMKQFQTPHINEGWDEILIFRTKECQKIKLMDFFSKELEVPHDCGPYHMETIQEHMRMCAGMAREKGESRDVVDALLFHDLGKLYTKGFFNAKGEPSGIAHYYYHENVSSYLFLTSQEWDNYEDSEYILYLIQYHMRPYLQGYDKFSRELSIEFIRDLEAVHKYDKLGRKII